MKTGFSLVELSIVLVILGLLTGGILAGKALIRASELRAVTMEYNRYNTAVHGFKDRYFALPGDFGQAAQIWGAADGVGGPSTACATTARSGPLTCNGNGNGQLAGHNSYSVVSCATSKNACLAEAFQFWQHLANAGLIEGGYSGTFDTNTSPYSCTGGLNCPASKLGTAVWYPNAWGNYPGTSDWLVLNYGNAFLYGGSQDGINDVPVLSPEEAWNIDTKMDDGMPGRGKFMAMNYNSCASPANSPDATYRLTLTNKLCGFIFPNAF